MTLAIVETTARLIKLQGNVTTHQVKRRAIENFGERSTVTNAVTKTLKQLVDASLIKRVEIGLYEPTGQTLEMNQATWLLLQSRLYEKYGPAVAIDEIKNHPLAEFYKLPEIPVEKQFQLGDWRLYFELDWKPKK